MHEHDKEQIIEVEKVNGEVYLENIPATDVQSEEAAGNVGQFSGSDYSEDWKQQNFSDNSDYDINFLTGIYCLFNSKYKDARHFFLTAVYDGYPLDEHYSTYQSYLGLSDVLIDYKDEILNHCYHSTDIGLSIEPEVQLNLACAELIKGDRKRAFDAMDKVHGVKLSSTNSRDINSLFDLVGKRMDDQDGLPKRDKFFNKSIGRLLRKKENFDAGDIEAFIINIAKKRYKSAMHSQLH